MTPRSTLLLVAALSAAFAGCAKTGDPQPPVVRIPKPAVDLTARQSAETVVLSVSPPAENTDGSPVATLGRIELLRVRERAGADRAPLSEEVFLERAEKVADVAEARLGDFVRGGRLVLRDEGALADPTTRFASLLRYSVRSINRRNQTAGLGNQAVIAPVPVALPPDSVQAEVSQAAIRLRWAPPQRNVDGSAPAAVGGYDVFRSEDAASFPDLPRNSAPLTTAEFEEREFEFEKTYYYRVTAVAGADPKAESGPSQPLRVDARDRFAPGPPENLDAVAEAGKVFLFWTAPPEPDVAGYRVYRAQEGAALGLLSAELVTLLSFRDERPPAGKKARYAVRAVDRHGNEGAPASREVDVP